MKKNLSISFLTFLVLSACSSVPPKTAEIGTAKQPAFSETAPVTEEVMAEFPVSHYGSNMKCDVLKDVQRQKECEMQINDMIGSMLESEIVASYDVDRCKELPADVATRCQERLNEIGVKGPVSAEEISLFDEITQGTVSADQENPKRVFDSARCVELKTTGYKEYCGRRIVEHADQEKMMEIILSENKNRCNELATENAKNDCKRFFGEEVAEPVIEDAPVVTPPVEMPVPVAEPPAETEVINTEAINGEEGLVQ